MAYHHALSAFESLDFFSYGRDFRRDFMALYNTGFFDDIVLRVEVGEKGKIVTEYVPAVFHRKASFGEPPTYKHPEPTEAEPEAPADVPPAP